MSFTNTYKKSCPYTFDKRTCFLTYKSGSKEICINLGCSCIGMRSITTHRKEVNVAWKIHDNHSSMVITDADRLICIEKDGSQTEIDCSQIGQKIKEWIAACRPVSNGFPDPTPDVSIPLPTGCKEWKRDICALDKDEKIDKDFILAFVQNHNITLANGATPTDINKVFFALKPKGGDCGKAGTKLSTSDGCLEVPSEGQEFNLDPMGIESVDGGMIGDDPQPVASDFCFILKKGSGLRLTVFFM